MQYIIIIIIIALIQQQVAPRLNKPEAISISSSTTFHDLINALPPIGPVLIQPPSSLLCRPGFFHTLALSTLQNGTRKNLKQRLNVKTGHSTHAAYLMHISLLSTRWRHLSHNCLQLKVNTHKKRNFQSFLYKTQECNASGVLLSVNTESPFYNCFVFFRQSCTITALSSNMHLVLSHRCVRTIWFVWKPPGPDARIEKAGGFVPR